MAEYTDRVLGYVWNAISYAWLVISNLITLAVTLAIFNVAESRFQTAVLALLILTYIQLIAFSGMYGLNFASRGLFIFDLFSSLKKQLGTPLSEDEQEVREAVEKRIRKASIKSFINVFFLFLIFLVAIWNLIFEALII